MRHRILAVLELIGAIVLFVLLSMEGSALGAFSALIGGIIAFFILLGTAEAIGVFIGIEENTRALKEVAAKLLQSEESSAV